MNFFIKVTEFEVWIEYLYAFKKSAETFA